MSKRRIIIYSNRFLIVKGLECFLQDNFDEQPATFSKEIEFLSYIQELDKAMILWDNDLMDIDLLEKLSRKNFIILSIGRVTNNFKQFIADFIPLKAESNYVYSQLKNYIEQLRTPSTTDIGDKTDLTEREKEIIRLVALGKTNQQIAEELSISPHTVITHRKNITSKLGIKTISGLTIYAILNGLVSMEEVEKSIK